MNDLDLLSQYAEKASEEAFATLVQRHLNFVYVTALRQVRSPQMAEDVAQSVFLSLAKNARALRPDTILTAWLYRVTRFAAVDHVRRESRREQREQIALDLANMKSDSPEWPRIERLLDEVLETLEEPDRNAILLRFFQNKSLREVGETLGTSEEAARKRVSRAVEQLREVFARRGIAVGAAGLVVLLGAQALPAAPAGLGVAISAASLSGAAVVYPTTILAATKAIAMTMMQKTLITAAFAAAVGTGFYEARQASRYQEARAAAQQNLQLQNERDDATNQFATVKFEAGRSSADTTELAKLRREVARLRNTSQELAQLKARAAGDQNDPTASEMKSWLDRTKKLKDLIAQTPGEQIPEFKLLKDQDWLNAVKSLSQLETDADYGKAVAELRSAAKNEFAGALQGAIGKFAPGQQRPDAWPTFRSFRLTSATPATPPSCKATISRDREGWLKPPLFKPILRAITSHPVWKSARTPSPAATIQEMNSSSRSRPLRRPMPAKTSPIPPSFSPTPKPPPKKPSSKKPSKATPRNDVCPGALKSSLIVLSRALDENVPLLTQRFPDNRERVSPCIIAYYCFFCAAGNGSAMEPVELMFNRLPIQCKAS